MFRCRHLDLHADAQTERLVTIPASTLNGWKKADFEHELEKVKRRRVEEEEKTKVTVSQFDEEEVFEAFSDFMINFEE